MCQRRRYRQTSTWFMKKYENKEQHYLLFFQKENRKNTREKNETGYYRKMSGNGPENTGKGVTLLYAVLIFEPW